MAAVMRPHRGLPASAGTAGYHRQASKSPAGVILSEHAQYKPGKEGSYGF